MGKIYAWGQGKVHPWFTGVGMGIMGGLLGMGIVGIALYVLFGIEWVVWVAVGGFSALFLAALLMPSAHNKAENDK